MKPTPLRTQAVPRLITMNGRVTERYARPRVLDWCIYVLVGLGLAASVLALVAVVLGAAWLVLWLAIELARLLEGG